uniref:RING-type domain-containing protein n=1 Tax=Globodera pallida TaxID=36090 RepID=A0A183CJ68_GLOPA
MALQIPSLALLSGLTIFLAYFTPSTTATSKWPGNTVAEKIRLLEAVSPSATVGKVREYCKQQYIKNEQEWKEVEQKRNQKLMDKLLSHLGFKDDFDKKMKGELYANPLNEQEMKEVEQKRRHKLCDFDKKMEKELYANDASQISRKYIKPFADCERDCIYFKSKWTKAKLRLEELQNVVETDMAGAKADDELNLAKSVGAKRSATAKPDDHGATTSGAKSDNPNERLTKLDQTKQALAKLKQLDMAPSKLDNNAEMTVGTFDQALKGLGKPDQKKMSSKSLKKILTLSKWETTPLNKPNITPRKFDQQLSPPWENTAPSSPMAPQHQEEDMTPLFSTQKTDSARFSPMAWLSPTREAMPTVLSPPDDNIPVSGSSPHSLSSPMALSRLMSWPDPYTPNMENSQHNNNNVMALTTLDKADIVLEKLEYAINNKFEAFYKLIESNECFNSVFAIPSEVVEQLKELNDFNLLQKMTDTYKKAQNGRKHGNTSSSPLSDTSRIGTNA